MHNCTYAYRLPLENHTLYKSTLLECFSWHLLWWPRGSFFLHLNYRHVYHAIHQNHIITIILPYSCWFFKEKLQRKIARNNANVAGMCRCIASYWDPCLLKHTMSAVFTFRQTYSYIKVKVTIGLYRVLTTRTGVSFM